MQRRKRYLFTVGDECYVQKQDDDSEGYRELDPPNFGQGTHLGEELLSQRAMYSLKAALRKPQTGTVNERYPTLG